jgi:hypothetical protein
MAAFIAEQYNKNHPNFVFLPAPFQPAQYIVKSYFGF